MFTCIFPNISNPKFNLSLAQESSNYTTEGTIELFIFKSITLGIFMNLISIFGLMGNVVAIIVLSRPSMKGSFSSLLIALSMFDLVYLMIGIAIFGLPVLSMDYKAKIFPFILPIGFGICNIARVGSVFVTMSVTIKRYFAIVHPLR